MGDKYPRLIHLEFKFYFMPDKKKTGAPIEVPHPEQIPEIKPEVDPEYPLLPEEDPDVIPEEDPFVTPPYEVPEPGEGP
jgi:hypothetical protein